MCALIALMPLFSENMVENVEMKLSLAKNETRRHGVFYALVTCDMRHLKR